MSSKFQNWDEFFIEMAHSVAQKSKDPSTKTGVVIVGEDNTVIAVGYNGFPRGVDDSPKKYADRTIKYPRVSHAEANAVANCARLGIRMKGAKMYTNFGDSCCNECAKLLIQAGITEIIGKKEDCFQNVRWQEAIDIAHEMFDETGVKRRLI